MLRFLKGFFGKPTPPDVTPKPETVAPYKVEAPAVTPVMVPPEPVKLTVDGHSDVQEVKPAKKAPAKKIAPKKPAAMKAPAKPKAPRKPKATK